MAASAAAVSTAPSEASNGRRGTYAVAAMILAQAETAHDWGEGAKNVIFICVFLLVVIAVAIWWLRRG